MRIEPEALLTLAQWLSPSFPVSAYAYSHGLEAAIAEGAIGDAPTLEAWLDTLLAHGSGWTDAVLLAHAMRDGADTDALDALARALAPSAERREETAALGAAFARTAGALAGVAAPPRAYPVALGTAARTTGAPAEAVIALHLHAFAGALVSAAVRFVPLGQTEGQAVLIRLAPRIAALAAEAAEAPLAAIGGCAWTADIAAMQHETLTTRIFRT